MSLQITLKDHLRETQVFTQRAVTFVVISGLLLLVILARLAYLQIIDHEHYTTLSKNNRMRVLPIAPMRGLIHDRNGVVLAQNTPSYVLNITPEQVEDMDATLAALQKLITISDQDIDRFKKLLHRSRSFQPVPLRFHLNDSEVAKFAVNRHRFPGVDVDAQLTRQYPLGELGAHVVGYVGRINENELQQIDTSNYEGTDHIGKTGVEKFYESVLHGLVGHQEVETNAQGRIVRVLKKTMPVPGQNLYLNIDARLQQVATDAFGDRKGALVAINPSNGAVLAMVNMPSFDPNLFVNGIDPETYSALTNSPDRPLFNRAIRGQYPPGSTAKPFLGLAGLEYGVTDAEDHTYCPGWFRLDGVKHKYRDWKKTGHGMVDLDKAIVQSCDVYFYNLASHLGIDKMAEYLGSFGFGRKTGIDINGELSGLMPSREWKRAKRGQPWYPGETVITGIGQGYLLVTPLQLANVTATLANGGSRMLPKVVYGLQDPASNKVEPIGSTVAGTVEISDAKHWESVVTAMHRVVHSLRGTARRISHGIKYQVAGKTGTAQVFGVKQDEEYDADSVDKKLRDHALFIAFAPVENPRISVAVIVENGGHGGSAAAPIARKVMDAYLLSEQGERELIVTKQGE
jgi:penicillin-binding protein 2